MKFGVFDHVDDSGLPLAEHLEARLRMAEAYDRLGFHCYHVAEHHGTPLGLAPSPGVSVRRAEPAHARASVRAAGLPAAALPPAAADRGSGDARRALERALPARHRARRLADRARLLRARHGRAARPLRRDARSAAQGAVVRHARLSGRVLPVRQRADGAAPGAAAASAAVVRRRQPGIDPLVRAQRRQHGHPRARRAGAAGDRPLPLRMAGHAEATCR